jgi:mannose-6-phosphate isomerase-like protein (cupin superfamily)
MFQKISARAEEVDTTESRTLPHLFGAGSGMRRFVVPPDLAYRAGYTKVAAGQGIKTFFWYDEFWVVLEGEGKVTAIDRPSNTTMNEEVRAHDLVYIPAGTHISLVVPGDGHILFFYIAIPASSKHAPWLASMTPEDIEDIKIRREHTNEGYEAEALRGKPLVR